MVGLAFCGHANIVATILANSAIVRTEALNAITAGRIADWSVARAVIGAYATLADTFVVKANSAKRRAIAIFDALNTHARIRSAYWRGARTIVIGSTTAGYAIVLNACLICIAIAVSNALDTSTGISVTNRCRLRTGRGRRLRAG